MGDISRSYAAITTIERLRRALRLVGLVYWLGFFGVLAGVPTGAESRSVLMYSMISMYPIGTHALAYKLQEIPLRTSSLARKVYDILVRLLECFEVLMEHVVICREHHGFWKL